jgi:hypothetical protein
VRVIRKMPEMGPFACSGEGATARRMGGEKQENTKRGLCTCTISKCERSETVFLPTDSYVEV